MLVTQLGIIVVSFADTMMVGAYGVDELAAAAFVNSLFVIPTVMQIGFAQGLTPLAGALFGKGDRREAGRTLRAGLQINIAVSITLTAVMGILYFFLDRFGQPEELMPLVPTSSTSPETGSSYSAIAECPSSVWRAPAGALSLRVTARLSA